MGHGVGLHPSRPRDIPVFRAHGDLFAQQGAGPRAAPSPAPQRHPAWRQQPVDGGGTQAQDSLAHLLLKAAAFRFVMRQPLGQRRFQPLAAGLLGCQPYLLQDRPFRLPIPRL